MAKFERAEIGRVALIQETECGRIRQIGLTEAQSVSLQAFLAILSESSPLVAMGEDYDLILKRECNNK